MRNASDLDVITSTVSERGNGIFCHLKSVIGTVAAQICVYHVMRRNAIDRGNAYLLETVKVRVRGQALYLFVGVVLPVVN